MASSKVMASASPPNPDLPRQSPSSAVQQQHASSSSSSTGLTQTTTTPSSVSKLLLNQPNPQPTPAIIINNNSNNNSHLHYSDRTNSPFGSMNMEEILKNIYSEPDSLASAVDDAAAAAVAISAVPPPPVIDVDATAGGIVVKNGGGKTVDDVWTGFVNGGGGGDGNRSREQGMTLEAFLAEAGAMNEEDVRVHNSASTAVSVPVSVSVPAPVTASGGYGVEALMNVQFPVAPGAMVVHMQNEPGGFGLESPLAAFGNGMMAAPSAAAALGGNGSASGRGKRRVTPVEELALDKATQQKQRRMIKNRESAARSRERKQAYTVELESLVTQLEEENARLMREEEQQNKERFKQLMENLIPVVEKRRPPRVLRRVNSSSW